MAGDISSEELGKQEALLSAIKGLLEGSADAGNRAADAMSRQAQQAAAIKGALSGLFEQSAGGANQFGSSLEGAAEAAGEAANKTDAMNEAIKALTGNQKDAAKSTTETNKNLKKSAGAAAAASAAYAGLNGALAGLKSGFNLLSAGITAVWDISKAAVGAVFGIWKGLTKAANNLHKAGAATREAYEGVREEFGSLASNEGAAVLEIQKGMAKSGGLLAASGRSVYGTFGNLADRLKAAAEIAKGAGHEFTMLKDIFIENAREMVYLQKATGISSESMTKLAADAKRTGKDMGEELGKIASVTVGLSDKFGVSAKVIGKGFDEMTKDTENFGHLAPKTLLATATYAAKLGVEVKALTGLMDKFDTFEGAAEAAGKLNEMLGMNIDTMEMLHADNPAERMDMIRKAFEDTGKSVEDLNRHELKAMSESLGGMPVDQLKNALAMPTDDMNFDEIAAEAEAAQEQISPEEAMKSLGENIKKLTKAMSQMSDGGFWANWKKGVGDGLSRSKGFRDILKTVGKAMKAFYQSGRRVGKILGKLFEETGPFGNMVKAFKELLSLEKINVFLSKVEGAFSTLMEELKTDPGKAVENFLNKIKEAFVEWTGGMSGPGGTLVEGLKNGLIAAIKIVGDMAPKILSGAAKYIQQFADALGGAFQEGGAVNAAGEGIGGALVEAFNKIKPVVVNELLPAIGSLFGVLWDLAKPIVMPIVTKMFLFMITKGMITAMAASLASAGVKAGIEMLAKKFSAQTAAVGTPAKPKPPGTGGLGDSAEGQGSFIKALAKISPKDIAKATVNLFLMGAGFVTAAAGVVLVMGTVFYGAVAATGLGPGDWALLGLVMIQIGVAMGGAYAMIKGGEKIGEIPKSAYKQAAIGLAAAAVTIAVAGPVFVGALAIFGAAVSAFNLDWLQIGEALIALGLAVGASVGLIMAAALVGPLVSGPQLAIIGAGLLGLAGALVIGAPAMVAALGAMGWIISKINPDWVQIGEGLLATGVAVGAAGALILAALGIGSLLMNPVTLTMIGAGFVGLAAALALGMPAMVGGLFLVQKAAKAADLDYKMLYKLMPLLGMVLGVMTGLLWASVKVGKFFLNPLSAVGFGAAAIAGYAMLHLFFKKAFPMLLDVLKKINDIPVADPQGLKTKVEMLEKIINAMMPMVDVGMRAAEFAERNASTGWGPWKKTDTKKLAKIMDKIQDFTTGVLGSVKSVIDSIKGLITVFAGMSVEQMEKMSVVADILGAVAKLAAGMIGPMASISKLPKEAFENGADVADIAKAMGEAVKMILDSVGDNMKNIIDKIISIAEGIKDPKKLKPKMDIVVAAMGALAQLFSGIGQVMQMMTGKKLESRVSSFDDGVMSDVTTYEQVEVETFDKGGKKLKDALNLMASLFQGKFLTQLKTVFKGMETIANSITIKKDQTAAALDAVGMIPGITAGIQQVSKAKLPATWEIRNAFSKVKVYVCEMIDVFGRIATTKDVAEAAKRGLTTLDQAQRVFTKTFDPGKINKMFDGTASFKKRYLQAWANSTTPYDVAYQIVAESIAIADLMQGLDLGEQQINLVKKHGSILGINNDGPKEISIVTKGVNVKLHVDFQLDSKDLALGISKGAQGESFFQVTEAGQTAFNNMES
ncbi:MAG: hypothetical protein CBC29_05500 [Methylococcaceae bacterium TMED69]|nr:MAG: hypothetical protein CBC29_05500 [Methylococcaceae bacterium TMED69]